jgi:hypothetical protein
MDGLEQMLMPRSEGSSLVLCIDNSTTAAAFGTEAIVKLHPQRRAVRAFECYFHTLLHFFPRVLVVTLLLAAFDLCGTEETGFVVGDCKNTRLYLFFGRTNGFPFPDGLASDKATGFMHHGPSQVHNVNGIPDNFP